MDKVLGDDMIPVILAALVPRMVYPLIVSQARAVVDSLELDAPVGVLSDVSNDVESGEHGLLGVGLTGQWLRIQPSQGCDKQKTC